MNKEQRLKVVKQFEKLNLEYDKELRHTVSFAAKICNSPVAMITLLDEETQWIKVKKGITIEQIPGDISFCRHAIKHNHLFIINDTHKDERFCNHPNVTGGLKTRFYAAAPLTTREGHRVGTLCIMDIQPHELSDQQKLTLKILAKHAIGVMELKLTLDQLDKTFTDLQQVKENKSRNDIRLRSMFESLTDSYFLLGKHGEIIDFNRTAFDFVNAKYTKKLAYGCKMNDFLPPDFSADFNLHYRHALKGEKTELEQPANYGAVGTIWWDCAFEPVRNDKDEIIGVSYVARNITERKASEEKIMVQNRLLSKIAQIQSHDYRGPVASILGLMNLIELEDYVAPKEYLLMMQTAVKNLDEKIHDVINIVNDPLLSIHSAN
ncbi:MAG TPA: GAF domain-containing protein [Mucilaginibacter sp.]|jgi:PAS domain S-box-containing protein|nr:GAF domain-containing protein [Mucilaginibacter sp.]